MSAPDPITACLRGDISPEVALARLVLNGDTAAAIQRRLQDRPERNERWSDLRARATDTVIGRLRHMLHIADVRHDGTVTLARIAEQFDRAVTASPEASVALYSLGDTAILRTATAEIIDWLRAHRLIHPAATVLDLGCGIGRVAAALSRHVRAVHGIDVSPAMVREAENRCAGLPNVTFAVTDGTGLAASAEARFDLVLAVDSFPYLLQAGLAEAHIADSRRVLRHGGHLAVLNLSYRGDPAADRQDAARWAERHGFTIVHQDARPFRLWDASSWIFQRA